MTRRLGRAGPAHYNGRALRETSPPDGTWRAASIAAVTAFVTLATQVLVHRIVSVKLVNNFAFLVISLTMLGFALSGVVLTRWRKPLLERREEAILVSAALFVPALLVASWVFCAVPPGPQWAATRGEFVLLFLRLVPVAVLYSAPFGFCGLILGLLLSAPDLPARRIYGFDLAGSALGAFAVIPVISALGAEAALLWGAAVLLGGCLVLCRAGRRAVLIAGASAVLLAVALAARPSFFPMRYPEGSVLNAAQVPSSGFTLEHVGWDPVARIEVTRIPPPAPDVVPWPFLVGGDPLLLPRFERILTQNNTAFTYALRYDGQPGSLAGLEQTLYAGAYQARTVPSPRVLVIGVGGGIDMLAGLHHQAAAVTGVEVNGATIRILRHHYRDYFRHWVDDPRVRLVEAEGRNFLSRSPEAFDVIQLSGVDSASGIPGAAHVFSENYLYTSEAFDLFLSRLTPRGVLSVMRQEWRPAREMLRVLTTAVDALRRAGVARPADHVVMLSAHSGLFGSLLVKRTAFTAEEVARVNAWASASPFFHLAAAPSINAARRNAYQIFLALDDAAAERSFAHVYPFDVRPPPDSRPFFFKFSRWGDLLARDPERAGAVPVMEVGLLSLFAIALLAVLACVLVPLRQLAGEGLRTEGASRHAAFFGAIAVGYMAVEMAFLQKFGLLLGHPNYSLSVVLASLLLASGLGAMFSGALVRLLGGLRFVGYALALLVLVEVELAFPLLPALMGRGFALRVLVVAALVLPVGLCLGAYLPTGLQRLKSGQESFVPWAWGINGIFSVLAPILAVAVATTWGVNALLLAAVPVYLAAGFVEPAGAVEAAVPEEEDVAAARAR
jgi:spermidine synthase